MIKKLIYLFSGLFLMFISFGLDFLSGYDYGLGKSNAGNILCQGKTINANEKNNIFSNYTKIPNPFYDNYYNGFDLHETKNFYVKNNSDKKIDYDCFTKEKMDPWHNQVYIEYENGNIQQIVCRK